LFCFADVDRSLQPTDRYQKHCTNTYLDLLAVGKNRSFMK